MNPDSIFFALQKGIAMILVPSGLIPVCMFTGLFIWPLKRKRGLARTLFFLAFLIYCLSGTTPVASILVQGLENSANSTRGAGSVPVLNPTMAVVLCGGTLQDSDKPVIDHLTPTTRARLLKALALCRSLSLQELVIAGGCTYPAGQCNIAESELAYIWLKELGIPEGLKISLETGSRTTEEQIANVFKEIGRTPCYLITSALNMPRTLTYAEYLGLHVRPVPCDYQGSTYRWNIWALWPSPSNLRKSDLAIHEYLGICWFWTRHFRYLVSTI